MKSRLFGHARPQFSLPSRAFFVGGAAQFQFHPGRFSEFLLFGPRRSFCRLIRFAVRAVRGAFGNPGRRLNGQTVARFDPGWSDQRDQLNAER